MQVGLNQAVQEVQVGPIVVRATAEFLDLGIALAESAEQPREWYGLGRQTPGPFLLVLVRDTEEMRRVTGGRGPTWGAGVTLPRSRTIVIRVDAGNPRRTFQHELAHLILSQSVRGRVPLWFAEGYAVVAAGEWGRSDILRLNLNLVRGRIPSLNALDGSLRDQPETARAAYALAGSAIITLARKHPEGTLTPLLTRLQEGMPFRQAVRATTGLSVDRFDEVWQRDIRRRYGVVVWLAAGGVWMVVAIWLLLARWVRRRGDQQRREALDQGWHVAEQ